MRHCAQPGPGFYHDHGISLAVRRRPAGLLVRRGFAHWPHSSQAAVWAGVPPYFGWLRETCPVTSEPASQPAKGAEIWIICGSSCAGKTTTARLLAQRLPLAAHVEGDEMQRLIVSGCRWAAPSDTDPGTGRLTGDAGVQYALRIRNACLVAAAFADAGITAVVTDTIINEGFEAMTS